MTHRQTQGHGEQSRTMKKNTKIILIITIGILLASLILLVTRRNVSERTLGSHDGDVQRELLANNSSGESGNVLPKISTSLEIDLKYNGVTETGVYDFMTQLRREGKINFTDKTYIGMGKFIDSINGVKGNIKESWIYYVNGKKAEVGVSNYIIKPGNVVSWKYERTY